MSGTSLDGVDLVCVSFDNANNFIILAAKTYAYDLEWFHILKNIAKLPKGDPKLKEIDVALGKLYGAMIQQFMLEKNIEGVDFIASHGHTVHHNPNHGYTLQIGSGREIFNKTNISVVFDFRTQDVLLGGQGAPLVPIVDRDLFSQYEYCLNLGGFANISYDLNKNRVAYDICPVNTLLNFYASKLGFHYDDGGALARSGDVNIELLHQLNQLDFYKKIFPKSLGVEFLDEHVFPLLNKVALSEIDMLATLTEHIAFQIAKVVTKGEMLVTGGGAYNVYLLERIKYYNAEINIVVPNSLIVEFKEAVAFAYLGLLRMNQKNNCLSSVTGANKDHCSGIVIEK